MSALGRLGFRDSLGFGLTTWGVEFWSLGTQRSQCRGLGFRVLGLGFRVYRVYRVYRVFRVFRVFRVSG